MLIIFNHGFIFSSSHLNISWWKNTKLRCFPFRQPSSHCQMCSSLDWKERMSTKHLIFLNWVQREGTIVFCLLPLCFQTLELRCVTRHSTWCILCKPMSLWAHHHKNNQKFRVWVLLPMSITVVNHFWYIHKMYCLHFAYILHLN